MEDLIISSSAFQNNGRIPKKYTCDGEDVNPPLKIEGVPENAKSLALIVDDPDAPMGTWVHWVVWDISNVSEIKENSVPGIEGENSFGRHKYGGPCPPSGTHRYFFKVYALDTWLNIPAKSKKKDVEGSLEGHILAKGEMIGLYSRS
ncbi:MAG: YbhB/YbcL family Raf kinase inhibitor-like protein [Nitrososphaeria archaeon]